MITAKHNKFINGFFRRYINLIIKRHFHSVNIIGDIPDSGSAVLMIGNHFSWWDGFFAYYINNRFLKKRFHVMMLEEQLATRKYFRGIGAFSVQPSSKSMFESLKYASVILADPENLLVIYPQGKIETAYRQKLCFGRGVMKIWSDINGPKPVILFYVALTDYFSNRKPTLNIYLSPCTLSSGFSLQDLETRYNDFYRACITLQHESWK